MVSKSILFHVLASNEKVMLCFDYNLFIKSVRDEFSYFSSIVSKKVF